MAVDFRRRVAGSLSSEALARLDGPVFSALVLALLVLAVFLAALGLERFSAQRRLVIVSELRGRAASPVAYGKVVPVAAVLAGPPGEWRALLRADSVPDAEDERRLCALAANGALPVRWVALTDALPACAAGAGTLVRPPDGDLAALRKELRSARWVVVDGGGRVRYNRRGVPTADEVRRTLALLRGEVERVASTSSEPVATETKP